MKGKSKYWNKISQPLIFLVICLIPIIQSCQEPDPFPITPQIQFNNIQYIELLENGNPDSLILYFDFQDGDGDLGLEGYENGSPYQDYNFYLDYDSIPITYNQTNIKYPIRIYDPVKDKLTIVGSQDIRPSYDCINYDILYMDYINKEYLAPGTNPDDVDPNIYDLDTIFLERNRYRNNIEVKYYRKRGTNNYEEIDWRYLTSEYGCGISFDGRFPILDAEQMNDSGSLEGTIRYAMVSTGFRTVLRKDTFNIKFQIIDRSLHISDIAETGDITLDQIIR
ncbi:hypothetical protein N7E81_16100 [Reichenbachiella carrageenanivorans]|uniref:Uncharacterized protein n=1 Tax=Reichenbachiella carrageenanivorans TaxID=2979869 RepID=A0ABY6CYT6_9BACT|nr:hypothetical protein [Reichenbachiella carrageenanivorans]UXX78879.1 hypothetical protein N7E81_16100 [Reichenbachiella carrageenanivorans]